eukprot:scaffold12356_cov63-Phaeocystis_antarctica.AAC.1
MEPGWQQRQSRPGGVALVATLQWPCTDSAAVTAAAQTTERSHQSEISVDQSDPVSGLRAGL